MSNRTMTAVMALGALILVAAAEPRPQQDVVRLDPMVAAAHLQSKIDPRYPPLAVAARVQAPVTVQLAINKEGGISNLKIEKGHPLLNDAAVSAVREWVYKPYEVDGQPAEVVTTVTIHFVLNYPPSIPSGMAQISGRVLLADGTPAAGASVDVALPEDKVPPKPSVTFTEEVSGEYRLEQTGQTLLRSGFRTSDSGEYQIDRLGPGTYRIVARLNNGVVYYYPGTSIEKAISVVVGSNDTVLVGVDFHIP